MGVPLPMDMTIVRGPHKFSLQTSKDHHGPYKYYGHYITSVKTFSWNESRFTELEMIGTKISSTAHVVVYELIT